jgi:SAM-dependent methyltransferase
VGQAMPSLSIMGSLRWDAVQRLLPQGRGLDVVEIGCGQGAVGVRLAADHRYLGLEPDHASYEVARDRLAELGRGEARCGSIELVEPGRTFDLVTSFEVIEHIEDDRSALASWVRLLRPGGTLIVSTPGYQSRYGPMDEAVGHFRRYEPAALATTLADSGLQDVEVSHYAMPIGYAIEAVRNVVARRRERADGETTMEERTGRSGRFLQPAGRAVGLGIGLATIPFRYAQRAFPQHGPVLLARGRRPAEG